MNRLEGQDIFADDFIKQEEILRESLQPTPIQKFYDGTTILITGATGFVGKILLEKLLRACPNIKKIYLLLRPKKGKSIEMRMQEELKEPIYELILMKNPSVFNKITIINSDLTKDNILSEEDRQKLIEEVDVVFHCAATVRFNEKLKQSVKINIKATKYFIDMAREMNNLKVFVYVSSAYANAATTGKIKEKILPVNYNYKKLVDITELLDDDILDRITPDLVGEHKNTYVLSKVVAENVVKEYGKGLPIGVFRPSIIISTYLEPLRGWINNIYGPQGVVFAGGIGLMRAFKCEPEFIADLVPVDMVCNALIAFAWDIGVTKGDNPNFEKLTWKEEGKEDYSNDREDPSDDVSVMHYVSCNKKPVLWKTFLQYTWDTRHECYSTRQIWHPSPSLIRNYYLYYLIVTFCHFLPALIVDTVCRLSGRKPFLWEVYKKIHAFTDICAPFSLREWQFEENTTDQILNKMTPRDKEIFYFDFSDFDWLAYSKNYLKGMRVYVIKDDMSTLPEGQKKARRLFVAHYTLLAVLNLIGLYILWRIFSIFF